MSEVQSRGSSSRGRGAHRGGRGGFRGSRGSGKPHSRSDGHDASTSVEEQGEVGHLKSKYSDKLPLLREVCEGWSDEDLVFALQEVNGDVEAALDRITSGSISQWGEVKKKPTKTKETAGVLEGNSRGRGRGGSESRGRGRGAERVARTARGGRSVSQANGTKSGEKVAKTTEEAFGDVSQPVVDKKATNGEIAKELALEPGKDQLDSLATNEPKPASEAAPKGSKVGGWAGLFAKPPPAPPTKQISAPPPTTSVAAPSQTYPEPSDLSTVHEPPPIEPIQVDDPPSELPSAPHSESAVELTPSKDELTEKNLDKLPDVSHPLASQTVASTTASTQDPMNPAVPTAAVVRPGMSGYAATALKATSGSGRTPSYSRKLMEQQQAVVMPGNHAVDRAAVQFGKMGLNGADDDAEDEREEPETRPQLPDDSPAAPRASLPPAIPEAKPPVEAANTETLVQRGAPGLPPVPQQPQEPSPQQTSSYTDQYRYGQGQKAYDPFTQQPPQGPATTEPFSNQIPGQTHNVPGGQDYSQYYGGNNRESYQQYYGTYGQTHENSRTGTSFSTSAPDTQGQYATARPGQTFATQEANNSGNNTPNPNPTISGHQSQHSQHVPGQNYGGYPYGGYPNAYGQQYPGYGNTYMAGHTQRYGANRPMFDDARRDNDYHAGNQYNYNHNQQYGANYKSNMYGQPHHYSQDYPSSPANNSGFGGRESTYGRAGSTQPSESQQTAASNTAFGSIADPFGRTPSGFGQNQTHGSHQNSEEQSKASGPSPSLQGNRPGSALNNSAGQQGSLPHPQSQQGFSGYPQYGAFGNQGHNTGYGGYGSNAGFGGYGGGYGRGWSGSYGGGGGHN